MSSRRTEPGLTREAPPPLPAVKLRTAWNWLPAFRLVAERESIRAAALALRIAPSAVSRSVKLLEDEMGVALFVRRGRALILTDEGRLLVEVVRRAMREVDDCIASFGREGPFVLGILDWLAPLFPPSLIT